MVWHWWATGERCVPVNPSDQIEAIVRRAVTRLQAVDDDHRRRRDAAAAQWHDPAPHTDPDDRSSSDDDIGDEDGARPGDDPDRIQEREDPGRRVLGPAQIAALSDAAGE